MKKRGLFVILIFFLLLSSPIILAEEHSEDKIDTPGKALDAVKDNFVGVVDVTYNAVSAVGDWLGIKTAWALGAGTFEGKYVWQEEGFLKRNLPMAFAILFWAMLFFPFTATAEARRDQSVYTFEYVDGFFQAYFDSFKRHFLYWKNWRPWLPVFYMVLMIIPILNRTMQIVTFEFLGLHWVYRSLIVATAVSFMPTFWRAFIKMKKDRAKYEVELEHQAAIEMMRARMR